MGMRSFLLLFLFLLPTFGQAQLPAQPVPYSVTLYGDPSPGYIFLTPQSRYAQEYYPGSLMILDSAGDLVFFSPIISNPDPPYVNSRPFDFKVQSNGTMTYAPSAGAAGYTFYQLDSTFNLIDTITCDSYTTDEHDMVITPDGHFHMICKDYEVRDASGLLTSTGIPGSPNCSVTSNLVVELDADQNLINSWYALDHIPIEDTQSDFYSYYPALDHVHTNSIDFDLDSNYILSNRNVSEITKVNRQTGDIMWRMGGKGNQFQLIGDTVFFNGQHHARIAPNGNLYVFDNARYGTQLISRYLEYEVDTVAMTTTLLREIQHPTGLNTAIMGNSQLMDDGHVIITWGGFFNDSYPANVSEYDEFDDIVMELDFPYDCISYRVHKQEIPFTFERPQIDCDQANRTLSAPSGHSVFEWSTGDTTQIIAIDTPGTYSVWVDQGIGFMQSEDFNISVMTDICLDVSQPDPVENSIALFPNPTQDLVVVKIPSDLTGDWTLDIYDTRGRMVKQQAYKGVSRAELSLSGFPNGIYLFRARGKDISYSGRVLKY